MRLAVAATPDVALPTLREIFNSKHELIAVITQPDRPAGRGMELRETSVSAWAKANNILLIKPENPSELKEISKEVDCVITVGYGVILPEEIINIPKYGYLNLHFSLLPRWRGAAPVQRAIEAGDEKSGVTVFKLDKGMDTGPVYTQKEIRIEPQFRSSDLFSKLSEIGATAVVESLKLIESGATARPQTNEFATRAMKISKEEACINWSKNSQNILREIKAFYPTPISWTIFRGDSFRIENAQSSTVTGLAQGELKVLGKTLHVGTGDGSIEILEIIPAGKKPLHVSTWLNGARISSGERFD